jgi:hypothetical protein
MLLIISLRVRRCFKIAACGLYLQILFLGSLYFIIWAKFSAFDDGLAEQLPSMRPDKFAQSLNGYADTNSGGEDTVCRKEHAVDNDIKKFPPYAYLTRGQSIPSSLVQS